MAFIPIQTRRLSPFSTLPDFYNLVKQGQEKSAPAVRKQHVTRRPQQLDNWKLGAPTITCEQSNNPRQIESFKLLLFCNL